MIAIKNLQKARKINPSRIRRVVKAVLDYLDMADKDVSVVLCDNEFIRGINKTYLRRNRATDVISFSLSDEFNPSFLGEIFVSVEQAEANSRVFGTSDEEEIVLCIVHGILHLTGMKDRFTADKKKMDEAQKRILRYLKKAGLLRI